MSEKSWVSTVIEEGRMVAIKTTEAQTLEQAARHMQTLARHRRKGWFIEYLRAHKAAMEIIKEIFRRSHAT